MKYKSFLSLSVLFLLFPCLALRAELDPPGGTVLFAFDDIWPFLGPSGEAPVISAPIASAGRPVTISVNAAGLGQWSQPKVTMLDEQFHELPGYTAKECTGPEQAGLHQRGTWGKTTTSLLAAPSACGLISAECDPRTCGGMPSMWSPRNDRGKRTPSDPPVCNLAAMLAGVRIRCRCRHGVWLGGAVPGSGCRLLCRRYARAMAELIARLQDSGVRMILLTPSPYDETVVHPVTTAQYMSSGRENAVGADAALSRCADMIREWARERRTGLVDVHAVMGAIHEREQKRDRNFSLISVDRIHPGVAGHFVMAYAFLKAQGLESSVATIAVDAGATAAGVSQNCIVSRVQAGSSGIEFDALEKSLPFRRFSPCSSAPGSAISRRPRRNSFFNELPTVLICDEQDPERTDIYNISAQPYPVDPSWYVAFPTFLHRSAATDAPEYRGPNRGPVEVEFAGSRGGILWNRYDRGTYAATGMASPDKKNIVFMGTGLVMRGDEIWQYGTEFESEHGDSAARQKKTDGVIVRYVQRVDGFVALTAGNREGSCRTIPLRVTGDRLVLNLDTGALGELRVGIVDGNGQPIPGCGPNDGVSIQGNATGMPVTWKGGNLSKRKGKDVRLDFKLRRTKLYSFRFE